MRKRSILLFILLSVLIPSGRAQDGGLTLEEAVAAALRNNPDVLRAQGELEASQARSLQAEARPDPEVVLSKEAIPWSFRGGEPETSLGVSQLFEFPGKRSLRMRIGRRGEEIAAAELERVRSVVSNQVKKAYIQASHSEKAVTLLGSVLDILSQYEEAADIRYRSGEVSATDVFRGRLEALKVRNDIIEARRALRADLDRLRLLMGGHAPLPSGLTTEMSFVPLNLSLEDVKRQAEERPSLRILRLETGMAEWAVELARKNFYPDFRLGVSSPSKSFSAWGFEVGTSIPLFRKGRTGELREAEAVRTMSLTALESRRMRALTLVESLYADAVAEGERLALFERSLLREADAMLRSALEEYRFGKTSSLGVFDIYRIVKETRIEHLRTLMNYLLSLAELEIAGEED